MINSIQHVSIAVIDQDRALKFYTEKLGFEVLVDHDFGEKQRWIELKLKNGLTKLVLHTPEGQENQIGGMSNIIFYTDDVQKTYNDLTKLGVEFTVPPTEESWGEYCMMKDSEGNVFCVSSS